MINPLTGGYTENCCNAGDDLQVHLIIEVDPRSIVAMGNKDIYSPAHGAIRGYLNNLRHKERTRETYVDYFSREIESDAFSGPYALMNRTFGSFNEVVVAGNMFVPFFKNGTPIKILGIGVSKYWIGQRSNASKESIEALKELSKTVPLIYYEPKTPKYSIALLKGKGTFEEMKQHFLGSMKEEAPSTIEDVPLKRKLLERPVFNFGAFDLLKDWLRMLIDQGQGDCFASFASVYNDVRSKIATVQDRASLLTLCHHLLQAYHAMYVSTGSLEGAEDMLKDAAELQKLIDGLKVA